MKVSYRSTANLLIFTLLLCPSINDAQEAEKEQEEQPAQEIITRFEDTKAAWWTIEGGGTTLRLELEVNYTIEVDYEGNVTTTVTPVEEDFAKQKKAIFYYGDDQNGENQAQEEADEKNQTEFEISFDDLQTLRCDWYQGDIKTFPHGDREFTIDYRITVPMQWSYTSFNNSTITEVSLSSSYKKEPTIIQIHPGIHTHQRDNWDGKIYGSLAKMKQVKIRVPKPANQD